MKIAFITTTVSLTECSITIAKAARIHDGVGIVMSWTRPKQSAAWEAGKVCVECFQDEVKAVSNLLLEIYRRFGEASLYNEDPTTVMHKLEKLEAVQVVLVGNEQVALNDVSDAKAVFTAKGCEGAPAVQADDEDDARSTLKRRMSRLMETETGPLLGRIAQWFANGCEVARTSADKPVAISQGDYLLGKVTR